MGATLCTCARDEKYEVLLSDPLCRAPSHLYDAIQDIGRELGLE
jgi:hypothetical protein